MKQRRVLSLLLVFALLVGLLPGMTLGVSAASEDHAITVLDSAPDSAEVAQGALYKLYMDEVFSDSEGHSMTYELLAGSNGRLTKMAKDEDGKDYLAFTDPGLDADTFTLRITAACSAGATKTYTLKITLTKAAGGDENQYGYDESPKSPVKVYLTISSDGVPLVGNDGTPLVHKEINVPYFDLENQGLSDFYRYHTEDGQGAYTDNDIVERPTALHLYLYAIGVYYLGLDPEDVTTGRVQINGHEGGAGVMDMDGSVPYEDEKMALNITGSATSLYMQQFWGHDENLMYYRNHVYPLMSAGWGSTADYILLSDGDTIDVAMFTDWSFWNDGGAFTAFDKDEYTVKKGDTLTVQTVKYDTKSVADGGTEEFDPISENLYLKLYKMNEDGSMEPVVEGIGKAEGGEDNEFLVDTSKLDPDVYYLLARDERTGEDARYAPATALVTVTDGGTAGECEHTETETTFTVHEPKDGKFDETVTCKDCSEVIKTTEHLYGDVDGDGEVGLSDAMKINTFINGAEAEAWQKYAADVNANGEVDVVDSTLVTQIVVSNIKQADLPVATDVTYTPTDADSKGNAQHSITIKLHGTDEEIESYPTEKCADADGDNKCDKCQAVLVCEHANTETAFTTHDPKDGKFDETVTCKDCSEVIKTTEHLYGDADGDGELSVSDAMKIVTINNGAAVENWQKHAADVNADGELDIVDMQLIMQTYLNNVEQADLPVETDVTYTSTDADEDGNAQHTVTIKYKGTDKVIATTTDACADTDSDGKCDKCSAELKTECKHGTTEEAYVAHSPADGKFDRINKCTACGKQVGDALKTFLYGDVDNNTVVNSLDAAYIMRLLAGTKTLNERQMFAADVNGDGTVDMVDAQMIYAIVNGGITQEKLPIETDITYTTTEELDQSGNHQHIVVVMYKGTDNEVTSFAETCTDADSDDVCDKCKASLKTECAHDTTESTFKKHDPKDGKFDEIVKCKDCGETISTTEHLYGDVNGDGELIVGGDFQYLIQIVNQGKELPTEWQKFAADVNEDGQIDGDDIALISAIGRNANIVLPGKTQRAYVYYTKDNKGVEKHWKTVTLPEYPDADLDGIYKVTEACTDEDGDGRCDLCLHCTHAATEVRDAKTATCTEAGYTGDTYCTVCNEKIADGEEIAMLEHADTNGDGKCDTCGTQLSEPVPTRKEAYPAETHDVVKTGMAYLLSDLQNGKIFQPVEGKTLSYKNYYYQRSTDGGETWGPMTDFSEALFGMTTIQLTELTEGTYTYRFYASHDGEHFSTDTWTLTLTVSDNPIMNFSFYVGKDYSGGYPIIKLYSVETDDEGNETMGDEVTDAFRYSDFTTTLPEGTEEYDPAQGKLVSNYQMFYAQLPSGRYMYRAFAKNADTGEYDVALGGMTLDLPTDTNVDGLAGGGTDIYLQCNSFYTNSRKTDNTYFTADEYHVRVDCPIMGCSTVMGDPYTKGNFTYYPTMLYAAGNACLYNSYFYPDIDGYIFTQNINLTFAASYTAGTRTGTINTGVALTVTVPEDATFGLYFQWNNFNTTEVAPDGDADAAYADRWIYKGDGTKHATYFISKGNGNYTWRLSDDEHVTKSGWLSNTQSSAEVTFTFDANAPTDKLSHDFSKLGTQTINRDEADIQVNLDPTGFKVLDGKTRVRAYRHWQLINSDAGNIMVEPDYEWHVINGLGGEAEIETVNGGNTTNNWADITPGTEDSFIAVHYYSVDVGTMNPFNGKLTSGSHGGLYPATNPERVGVIVVGGTGTAHGKADADVDFNIAAGATTTRSMDWDYNYDTWFYNDDDPEMTFTVKNANGNVDVSFAMVGFADNLEPEVQQWDAAPVDSKGVYHLPVDEIFDKLGNGRGGTVIIRMEDSDGVSYRLVRASKVDITATNVSHEGEPIMPGDQVKLSFKGMYRSVNKISGIFNPTTFKPTYYGEDGTKFEGTLGQYQRMDNAAVTVTIPENLTFAEGEETKTVYFGDGYTFGSMYSASNPFAFLYSMTDTGVGTNFNAVTVTYYLHHYAKAAVTVSPKVLYTVKLNVTDADGKAVSDVTVTMTDTNGKTYTANEDGTFTLGYGSYSYTLEKSGYIVTRGGFTLSSADAEKVVDGILTIDTAKLSAAKANGWDGKTVTEAKTDEDGTYLIGSAAELAWFAQQINAGTKINAKLTADIELAGYDWTPMNKFYGTFNGDGHTIYNLYINSTSYPVGLFGYVKTGASVTQLGITGNVTCNASSNAQAGGIAGYLEDNAPITKCFSAVNVTSKKHGGGIAGYGDSSSVISDCYATGTIRTTSTSECYLGGISGSYYNRFAGPKMTNCYSIATVIGNGSASAYIGALSPSTRESDYNNSYYLEGKLSGANPTGLGTAKTADELKALAETLGEAFTADTANINGGYPILTWQASETPAAKLDHIEITAAPKKTEYIGGEDFEADGMAVTAYYTDNTTKILESSEYEIVNGASLKPSTNEDGTPSTDKVSVTIKVGDKSAAVEVSVFALGDVNMDGYVNHIDAILVYAHYNNSLKEDKQFTKYQLRLANVNGSQNEDGSEEVNHIDAILIYGRYNNRIAKFPAEK